MLHIHSYTSPMVSWALSKGLGQPNLLFYSVCHVLYLLGFPINLLSINIITRNLNRVTIFFPFHCVLHNLHTGQRIGLGHENDHGIPELMSDTPS